MKSQLSSFAAGVCAAALTAALSAPAFSQEAARDAATAARERAVEQCQRMSSAELQIACLEAALEAAYRVRAAPAAPTAPRSRPDASGLGSEQVARREAGARASAAAAGSAGRDRGFLSRLNPFSPGDEAPAPSPERRTAAGPAASGLGAEQVQRREDRADPRSAPAAASLQARIVDADIHGYASLVFALDNGQVWRQLSADNERIDADDVMGATVIVSEAAISGYQAEITDIGRTIRVQRLR